MAWFMHIKKVAEIDSNEKKITKCQNQAQKLRLAYPREIFIYSRAK